MEDLEIGRLIIERHRELSAIRRVEREMGAEVHELERKLAAFDDHIVLAEETIDVYLRQENWGREPDHPAFWRTRHPNAGSKSDH